MHRTLALVGNPNVGKTAVFNALTGLAHSTGNYPGVTVDRKYGKADLDGISIVLVDLPGSYSLAARSPDEILVSDVLLDQQRGEAAIDGLVAVVDASNIERNLYFISQLLELGKPMVIALNMMDIAKRRKLDIDANALSERLGAPVIPMCARNGEGIGALRTAMRNTQQDWLREELEHALRTLVRNSREAKDFEALYELAGFYAAEVGISDPRDPFRDEFRRTLQAGANVFRERSEMKYIFMQTLLAEIFPDEALGQLAREEAIRLGFKAVATVGEVDGTSEFAPPSHLDGLSVITVDNSTAHHLLAFYDGPETFFVRFGPYRKGSVVLKDGTYRVAVIAPTGNIQPYRARVSLSSEQGEVVYQIEDSRSDDNAWTAGNMAWGKYTLLRKPSEVGSLTIDSETGSAAPWQTAKEAM